MSTLDSNKLHDYLSQAARDGRHVTEQEVADHFGVELGAVKKRFGLLTGVGLQKDWTPPLQKHSPPCSPSA